jgi:diguanylate cyclase (GGDEF)-like protein
MRVLSNIPIAARLAVAFSALLVLLGAVIAFALGQANRIGDSAHELASSSLHNVVLARDAQAAAQAGATLLHSLFLLRDQQQRIPVYQQIDVYTASRDSAIAELLSTTDSGRFHLAMLEVTRLRDAYVSVFNETVNTVELDDATARQMMLTETMPALRAMLNALDQLVVLQSARANDTMEGIHTIQQQSKRSILALGALAILVALVSATVITRSIATPIAAAAQMARDIAAGNLQSAMPPIGRDEVGVLMGALDEMRRDISASKERIVELAYQDTLTGLPNRTLFNERLRQAVAGAARAGHALSVLVLDLDRFKQVNDVLGHVVGDQLLARVAERLRAVIQRESDTIARIGGDEFALLLPTETGDQAMIVAQRLLHALDAPVELQGQWVDVGASIGIASFPTHGADAAELMSRADIAMYVAKQENSGCMLFGPELESSSKLGLSLLGDLRRAVESGELLLQYQPKIVLATGGCRSVEALVRWRHPTRGMVPPDQFIPFAERTGIIKLITRWVLEHACSQAVQWQRQGNSIRVSVNLSTRDLVNQDLPAIVAEIVGRTGLPMHLLCLEITESAVMDDPVRSLASLMRLHAMGIKLSIDDFGTGYSSLAYLKRLPVGELKIDRSFVTNLDSDAGDEVIVRSTIELAHNLGLLVVAEGIENERCLSQLMKLGCDEAQGYYFGRPMSAGDFSAWLARPERGAPSTEPHGVSADQPALMSIG